MLAQTGCPPLRYCAQFSLGADEARYCSSALSRPVIESAGVTEIVRAGVLAGDHLVAVVAPAVGVARRAADRVERRRVDVGQPDRVVAARGRLAQDVLIGRRRGAGARQEHEEPVLRRTRRRRHQVRRVVGLVRAALDRGRRDRAQRHRRGRDAHRAGRADRDRAGAPPLPHAASSPAASSAPEPRETPQAGMRKLRLSHPCRPAYEPRCRAPSGRGRPRRRLHTARSWPSSSPSTKAPPARARSSSTAPAAWSPSTSASSRSTSRGRAGSSTTRSTSGARSSRWRAARCATRAVSAADVAAIGITNQRETTVLWERASGKPVANAIVWQDRRTAAAVRRARSARARRDRCGARTGLLLDPYFSGTKIAWLLDNVEGLRARAEAGEIAFGTVDSWLVWNLTGGQRHVTDVTNAARTLLFDIHRLAWSDELLAALRIPRAILPEVLPCSADFGTTAVELFGGAIPIAGVAGDQHAALVGQAGFAAGVAKNTYGTGSFILLNTGDAPVRSEHGLLTTIAYALEPGRAAYALEGSVFVDRRGGAVAARRPGADRALVRRRAAGARGRRHRRRVLRAGLHGPGRAVLGPVRARHDRRPHPRHHARAPGPRGARSDGLPERRRDRRDGARRRPARCASCASTAARRPTASPCSSKPTCWACRSCARRCSRRPRSARRIWPGCTSATGPTPPRVARQWREEARFTPRMEAGAPRRAARALAPRGRTQPRLGELTGASDQPRSSIRARASASAWTKVVSPSTLRS